MKKLVFILFLFIFTSSAWGTVYKWVDQGGTINLADDYSKVPSDYRDNVEKVSVPKAKPSTTSQAPLEKTPVTERLGEMAAQPPSVSQQLVPEGDFALKLATALKLGTPETEAQAEDMLASVGIAPKNGWIADYPMTPIIIGQVQNAVIAAAALKKLPMGKDEALQAFQGLTAEFGLSIAPGQYAETPPPTSSEYVPPAVINSYYYEQGPPIVTYYPPPWDYYYLYAWVPYPFWYAGFFFPGFFILNDFHHFHHDHHFYHGHHLISNHFIDPKTHASLRVDPTTRTTGTAATRTAEPTGSHGFATPEARKGATSIFNRSANARTFSQLGNTGRRYRNFQGSWTGAGRLLSGLPSRSLSRPSSKSFGAPFRSSRGGSFGGFRGRGGFRRGMGFHR
jgi:hypothetical protein